MATTGKDFNLEAQKTHGQQIGGVVYELQKHSVRARCPKCFTEQFTRVNSKVSSGGVTWAILCCCFGSWLLSLLVLCMDGFREFIHYCPACNSIMGIYRPKFSGGLIALLVLITLGIIGIEILLVIFVILPRLNGYSGYNGYGY